MEKDGRFYTTSGRVLTVTGLADTRFDARDLAYRAVGKISFEHMSGRNDIGEV